MALLTLIEQCVRIWHELHNSRDVEVSRHLPHLFVKINGVGHYLWRPVDQDGVVLDVLVQRRRDASAAKKFFRKLLKGLR